MGGGAYYFLSDIRTVLPFALIAQNAEYVNALFYAKTASRIVEKQRLSQVKAAV